jgi:hypothetical protein
MKTSGIITGLIGASLLCAAPVSVQWSPEKTLVLSFDSASARVGRPLTPVSVAGVARRTTRRHIYGAAVVHPVHVHPVHAHPVHVYHHPY